MIDLDFGPGIPNWPLRDIKPRKIQWLWPGWLPRGELCMIVGRAKSGKSHLAVWLIAQLTGNYPWPDNTRPSKPDLAVTHEPETAGMMSIDEDEQLLQPKLVLAGAHTNMARILSTRVQEHDEEGRLGQRLIEFPGDVGWLQQIIRERALSVLVIDGIGAMVKGDANSYRDVVRGLDSLRDLAQTTGCTIVGISHIAKSASSAGTAAIGSVGWGTVARMTWYVGLDPTDESGERRAFAVSSTNYREPEHSWSFEIRDGGDDLALAAGFRPLMLSAEELMTPSEEAPEVVAWLQEFLAAGPQTAGLVKDTAKGLGYAWRTVQRYRGAAGVRTFKGGFGNGWVWDLE